MTSCACCLLDHSNPEAQGQYICDPCKYLRDQVTYLQRKHLAFHDATRKTELDRMWDQPIFERAEEQPPSLPKNPWKKVLPNR